ncbi:MAG TPA: S-layer homology domain-containing protein [Chloroflexia bacterium]
MSEKFHVPRRTWYMVVLGILALLVLFAGVGPQARAATKANLAGSSQQTQSGKPVQGPPATKSVVDLRTLPTSRSTPPKDTTLPFRLPHGPNAFPPAGKAAPGSGASSASGAQVAAAATLSITVSFPGINSTEAACGCQPPDGDMAVGPNHIVLGVNTAFQVFSKSGTPLTGVIQSDDFFGSCGAEGLGSSDPDTVYDPVADRYTIAILRYDSTTDKSFVSLGVTQSPDPTTTWNKYCFEQPYNGIDALYDFPHIGVGQDALFTTGNLYLVADPVNNISARVNAYDKAAMYSGAITATQVYSDVTMNSDMSPADTIRPALFNVGLPVGPTYFVNVGSSQVPGNAPSSRATVWRWTDPFGANEFVQLGGQDLEPYLQAVPMLQPPPGQPVPAEGFIDVRLLGAVWYNNTIYGTHTIGCDLNGTITDCVQWFQLGTLDEGPTLFQQGIISGAPTESRTYPNLAVDANGNVRLAYAFSSPSDFIGIRHVGRLANDPPGSMSEESVVKAGEKVMGGTTIRYGDYTGAVTDPDGVRLWHFEEYSEAGQTWGTWTSAAQFPEPAPEACLIQFQDIPQSVDVSSFYPYVRCLACKHIIGGYPCGGTNPETGQSEPCISDLPYYRPSNQVTRGQISKIVAGAEGNNDAPGSQIYEDVPTGHPFYVWINRLSNEGVMGGYPCGGPGEPCMGGNKPYFRPGANATRGQMSKIVSNAAGFNDPVSGQSFEDLPPSNSPSSYYKYVERLYVRGIVGGYPCGGAGEECGNEARPYFRPNNPVTRGQTAKIAANTFFPDCEEAAKP